MPGCKVHLKPGEHNYVTNFLDGKLENGLGKRCFIAVFWTDGRSSEWGEFTRQTPSETGPVACRFFPVHKVVTKFIRI